MRTNETLSYVTSSLDSQTYGSADTTVLITASEAAMESGQPEEANGIRVHEVTGYHYICLVKVQVRFHLVTKLLG